MITQDFVASYFSSPKPRLFAHRGLAVSKPENTLDAFREALEAGADYIESDIQITSDGQAVLCHDADLASYGISDFEIAAHSLAELQNVDLGKSAQISTLKEALSSFPEARFNLDLKTPLAIEPTVKVLNELEAKSRVLIASFRHSTLRKLRGIDPEIVTSASQREVAVALLLHYTGLGNFMKKYLRSVAALQIPDSFLGINLAAKRWINSVKKSGTEIHFWTINDPERARDLLVAGADGIVTDRTDLIFKMFQESQLR